MGISILFLVLIAVISFLAIYHQNKEKQNKQWAREEETIPWQYRNIQTQQQALPKSSPQRLDPRNPRTFRNATQNQLYIDGKPIYRYGSGDNWTIVRKPVTEVDFVDWIRINVKKQHFPTPEDRQNYYRDYIQWYYESNNSSVNVFGRFKFTDGMMELSSHLPIEDKEKIGLIFTDLLQSDPRAYRFQQELFDKHIRVDPLYFSKIALAASFQVEQDLMADYFRESEFETKAEALEYLNASGYLKKYPRLKEKVIQDITRSLPN